MEREAEEQPSAAPTGADRGSRDYPSVSGSRFAGLGLQFVIAILLFLYAGKWLDAKLGTAPVFLIAGVFLGAGASMYHMYRSLMRPPEP